MQHACLRGTKFKESLRHEIEEVKPLAAGIHEHEGLPPTECWAKAASGLLCTFLYDPLKAVSDLATKVMQDRKARKDVENVHALILRAQSWGFGTSKVERSRLRCM